MKRDPPPSGVLVIDKARGPTSHDVVARLRRALGTREVGHAGTLDPMATGVLIVLVGEATKLAPYMTAEDKEYVATLELGRETDTLDAEGKVTEVAPVPEKTLAALRGTRPPLHPLLEAALAQERARTEQVPPAFSAIQKGGERAYARARRGEVVTLDARPVHVKRLEALGAGLLPAPWLTVGLSVAKGYFVRSLGRDLAAHLGTKGHLTALRRTSSGNFTEEEAVPADTPADELYARLLPLGIAAARALTVARLSETGVHDARQGRVVRPEDLAPSSTGVSAWLDTKGTLVAIGEVQSDGSGRVVRGFRGC